MEGEINEILSVALSGQTLLVSVPDVPSIRMPYEKDTCMPRSNISTRPYVRGTIGGCERNVIQAIERTKSALNVKSKPQARNGSVEEDSSVVRDVLLDVMPFLLHHSSLSRERKTSSHIET